MSELLELLSDEMETVQCAAFRALVGMLDGVDPALRREQLLPQLKRVFRPSQPLLFFALPLREGAHFLGTAIHPPTCMSMLELRRVHALTPLLESRELPEDLVLLIAQDFGKAFVKVTPASLRPCHTKPAHEYTRAPTTTSARLWPGARRRGQ